MKITKRFSRKMSVDYQSYEFMTEIELEVPDPKSKEELIEQSDKLFSKVKGLTKYDIAKVESEIGNGFAFPVPKEK